MKFKVLLVILVAAGSVALGEINLKVGDPESQIEAALGEPNGKAVMNGTTFYMYDGGNVTVKNGKVASLPKDFEKEAQQQQDKREAARLEKLQQAQFEAEQRAKGLALYENQWVMPEQKIKLVAAEKESRQQALIAKKESEQQALIAKKESEQQAFLRGGMCWSNIILDPYRYLEKGVGEQAVVTLRGTCNSKTVDPSLVIDGTSVALYQAFYFSIRQDGFIISVNTDLLPADQVAKIKDHKDLKTPVEVTGTLQGTPPPRYPDIKQQKDLQRHRGNYSIQATRVSFYE